MKTQESSYLANTIIIYCDGACSGNPGPGGWASIIAIPNGEVQELGGGAEATTNNRMELLASIEGLRAVREIKGKVFVCTDSVYVIKGITQWIFGWKKKGWKTADGKIVANQDLWEDLQRVVYERGKDNSIDWKYVRGHTGVPGNERCDEIAVSYSKGEYVKLYRGPLIKYDVSLYDLPENTEVPEKSESPRSPKVAAYSYLSLLGGVAMRHKTWAECERRVKGQSGAKFKKTISEENEAEILKSWGVGNVSC